MKPGPIPGRALLNRIIDRLYEGVQAAESQEAAELANISLRLVALLRRSEPATLDTATYAAFGCPFSHWQRRNQERLSFMHGEYLNALRKPLQWPRPAALPVAKTNGSATQSEAG